jgi:hypothetical protein
MNILIPGLAAAISLLAAPANAQPPSVGSVGALPTSILCDTREQVHSILNAFEKGVEAGTSRFSELYRQINMRREPTCAVTSVGTAAATGSEELGPVSIGGGEVYAWIVHLKNGSGNAYYLYLESPAEALKNTI